MIQSRRYGESEFLNKIAEKYSGTKKTASDNSNHPASKTDRVIASGKQSNHPASKFLTSSISAYKARKARRSGVFVKVAGRNDLYQEIVTKDFWKISDDKQTVNRVNEDNGAIVE